MKRILLNILIILLMLIATNPTQVQSQKLLIGDEWQYSINDGATVFNETAIDTIQVRAGENAIATTVVDTDRPIENDYKYSKTVGDGEGSGITINLNMQETLNELWITQAGGFPINSYSTFSGTGEIIIQTPEYGIITEQRSFTNVISTDSFNGNPALALTTAESQTFGFTRHIGGDRSEGEDFLTFYRQYVISTDQSASDLIRNYTITPTWITLWVSIGENSLYMTKSTTETIYEITPFNITKVIIKPASLPQAQLYVYDSTNRLPILIQQTESAKIGALSLNSFEDTENPTKIVEYRLVKEKEALSTEDDSPLIFISSVIALVIFYRTHKKRRY